MNDLSQNERASILAGRVESGMGFRQRAWAVCARVRSGEVATYAAVAEALGGRAYRAVGAAMGANPFAPDVPCHRVVGSDGSLTGFAGGLAKKRKLLAAEGVTLRGQRVDLSRHGVTAAELVSRG